MAEKFKMVGMIVVMVTLYYVVTLALRPCIVVENDANILYCFKLNADEEIALQYVHSVEKTVVIEKIGLVNNELCIKEMLYQSFGAGLPFLVQQGQFRIENDWFIINDINEKITAISLRVSKNSKLTINYQWQAYNLYELIPDNSVVNIKSARYYDIFIADKIYRGIR